MSALELPSSNNQLSRWGILANSTLNPKAKDFKPGGNHSCLNSVANNISVTENNGKECHGDGNVYTILKAFKLKYINNVIIAHLNINSVRNKFELLVDIIKNNIDILLISETKLDESFPSSAFCIPGFSLPYRRDRSINGGGILIYVRNDIPSKILNAFPIPNDIECIKRNGYLINSYNPHKSQINNMLQFLWKCLDHFLAYYDNIILLGDFNSEVKESSTTNFSEVYNLRNLVKHPHVF